MILTHDVILEEIRNGNIVVEPYSPDMVGPASLDLHLDRIFRRFKKANGVYEVHEEASADDLTEMIEIKDESHFVLNPGETILGITKEKVTLPPSIGAWIEGRSRFARIGLSIHITAGFMHPGVSAKQVLEMSNLGPVPLALCPGTRICQLVFERCEGEGTYNGRFQNQTKP